MLCITNALFEDVNAALKSGRFQSSDGVCDLLSSSCEPGGCFGCQTSCQLSSIVYQTDSPFNCAGEIVYSVLNVGRDLCGTPSCGNCRRRRCLGPSHGDKKDTTENYFSVHHCFQLIVCKSKERPFIFLANRPFLWFSTQT